MAKFPGPAQLSLFDGQVCSACDLWKPFQKFIPHPGCVNGRTPRCRKCQANPEVQKRWAAANYRRNREKIIARVKAYRDRDPEATKRRDKAKYERHKEKIKPRVRAYQERNREAILRGKKDYAARTADRWRAWRAENLEWRVEYHRQWREQQRTTDPEGYKARVNAQGRSWRERNPDTIRAISENRRAREQGAGGTWTGAEFTALCDRYGNCCLRCGAAGKLAADHVIPLAEGGSNDIGNIQPLCKSCNSRKGVRTVDYRPSE